MSRSPVHRDLRTPKYRPRQVPDKRRKELEEYDEKLRRDLDTLIGDDAEED